MRERVPAHVWSRLIDSGNVTFHTQSSHVSRPRVALYNCMQLGTESVSERFVVRRAQLALSPVVSMGQKAPGHARAPGGGRRVVSGL
jgi:hypothetical protein